MHLVAVLMTLFCVTPSTSATDISIFSAQVFAIPIVPSYFNWTSDDGRNEYRYEASLLGMPDLPSWIHYTYSRETHRGYLYGVPPRNQKSFKLEIIALNKKTYETRDKVLEVIVTENDSVSKYQIQLKVNNWNVEDMFDRNRTETLFEVFRKNIWKNATDLQLTFLASADELGARNPLKPGGEIGTVLRLGSLTPFSSNLQNLEKEIQPVMKKFSTCDFKKTSFNRYFGDFMIDWCYFKLIEEDHAGLQQQQQQQRDVSASVKLSPEGQELPERRWSQAQRSQLAPRIFRGQLFASVCLPALLLLLIVAFISATLCLQHEHFISSNGKRGSPLLIDSSGTNGVQMIQYAITSDSRGTLRSLSATQHSSSPTLDESQSINRSPRNGKDHVNHYLRPNPPPYVGQNN
ncbi:hypothetical protein QAD02_022561 [Eretmocerus hayati]|uniref:Uncharacterized protein n=1 Tax=Eretmocerus hayati TaxID=131215 RepID=A0ACC2PTL4_9HYME|nr:hypothetical protein QAD02_022561 [Eretmocerus hayati]